MHVLQPVPVPKGTPAFEEKREKVIAELQTSIPKDFWLPESFFKNPPLDVTSVPSTCGILTPAEIIVTEQYDATGLAAAIAKKELSAVTLPRHSANVPPLPISSLVVSRSISWTRL